MAELTIEPEQLLVGLSYADRESLCTLIALYEESYLQKLVLDMFKDAAAWMAGEIKNKLTGSGESEDVSLKKEERKRAFENRLARKSSALQQDSVATESLRLRLWMHLQDGLGLEPDLAFYRVESRRLVDDLARRTQDIFARQLDDQDVQQMKFFSREYWKDYARVRLNPFTNRTVNDPTFPDVIRMNTLSIIAAAAERGSLPGELQAELTGKVRQLVAGLAEKERRQLLAQYGAEQVTDSSAMKMLLDAHGLFRLGLGKELAGLAAYILVANSSALVPLLGGTALTGTTAVLANPLFVLPVVLLGGVFLARNLKSRVRQAFGIAVSTILVLKAIAERKSGTDPILRVFRHLPEHLPEQVLKSWREAMAGEQETRRDTTESRAPGFLKGAARRLAHWARDGFVSDDYPNALDYLRRHQAIEAAEDKELMKKASARLRSATRSRLRDSKLREIDRQLAELAGEDQEKQTVREGPRPDRADTVSKELSLDEEEFSGEDTRPDALDADPTDPELQVQTVFDRGASGQRASSQAAEEFTTDDQTVPEAVVPRDIDHRDTSLGRIPLERMHEPETEPDTPADRRLTVQGKPPLDEEEQRLAGMSDDDREE